jgi:transposase
MNTLEKHYRLLLGLNEEWHVASVDLSLENSRVEIRLQHAGGRVECPECGGSCSRADYAPERTWRHLDTMQFETILKARTPRAKCKKCGVKTTTVPWATKSSRFTLLFEALAIEVLLAASSVKRAAMLLGIDWESANRIMQRAVDRGLERRTVENVEHIGIDEKSFRKGQNYVSIMTDISGSRVLEVSQGRDEQAANKLWQALSPTQRSEVQAVAMDMWSAYMKSTTTNAPQAAIVHDKFHVSKHLNEGVDQVRRGENKELKATGDETLVGTKHSWLYNYENISEGKAEDFEVLRTMELKTSRAWAMKEQFRWFWRNCYAGNARKFFAKWYAWASRSRLKPMIKRAKMLKRHLENLLTYFRHPITNSMSEGYNSKIQGL